MRGDRLRQVREQRGISQRELAAVCDIGEKQIWRYENGESNPTSDILEKIVAEMQVSADDVLNDLYEDELRAEAGALKRRRARLAELEREQSSTVRQRADRRAAYDEIVGLSVEVFWGQPGRFVNQILHRLMGEVRFAVRDGAIAEMVDKPPPPFLRRVDG